ncbi:MAG TPA: hypothetical protein VGN06_01995 [Gaiellaceae bacterium]|jgi:hypothetical protein
MSGRRVTVVIVLLGAAVVAGLLAADVSGWRTAVARGDAEFAQSPASANWHAGTVLPFHVARGILGLSDQLALRSAAKQFVYVRSLGNGVDNGYSESLQRGALEGILTRLAAGPDRARDSDADLMLGILAFADTRQHGAGAPAPVDQAVADFQSAVTENPANTDAKYDLELLLRYLVATGSRTGSNNTSGGPAKGHKGAGGGQPGTGY